MQNTSKSPTNFINVNDLLQVGNGNILSPETKSKKPKTLINCKCNK